jgi:hypothetical protein
MSGGGLDSMRPPHSHICCITGGSSIGTVPGLDRVAHPRLSVLGQASAVLLLLLLLLQFVD